MKDIQANQVQDVSKLMNAQELGNYKIWNTEDNTLQPALMMANIMTQVKLMFMLFQVSIMNIKYC